jgi:hypothetical protein
VKVPHKGPRQLQEFRAQGIEVIALNRDGTIDVVAEGRQVDYLLSLPYGVSIIGTPDMASAAVALDQDLDNYHTYAEMETELNSLAATYPSLTDLTTIGTTIEGRNIYVLKISDNVTVDEAEPEVLYMGCHHARELMSVEIPLRFAKYLLENYTIDMQIQTYVNEREIFFAPMINPDGHVYVQNNHAGAWWTWWRKNRRPNPDTSVGVYLNPNYGYQCGFDNFGSSPTPSNDLYRGTAAFSEPETQAVRDFVNSRDFVMAFSYHSYGELLLYGPGWYFGYLPDHNVYLELGRELTSTNGYFDGNAVDGAIYLTNGDSDDWLYGEQTTKNKIFSFTPEVNTSAHGGFGPPDTEIQPTFDLLLPMNLTLLELAADPYQVVGPYRPSLFPVDNTNDPNLIISWDSADPMDPNQPVSYELIEYRNLASTPQDGANAVSPLWSFDTFTQTGARFFEGTGSYYSGQVANNSATLTMSTLLRVQSPADVFTAKVWYDIEVDWDYAYVEVSSDGGLTWATLPGDITTNTNPNGANHGNGITGSSGGWVDASFSLAAYDGEDIILRINYITDSAITNEGLYVDIPGPVATSDNERVVVTGYTGGTSIIVAPNMPGDYTYQVRALDGDGDWSLWSNTESATINETATGIRDEALRTTALGANHPNPFNPVTTIPYRVGGKDPATVDLIIFDAAGRRVRTLVSRTAPPGAYSAVWRGNDDGGVPVASGVYFARLRVAGDGALVRKLVLLK